MSQISTQYVSVVERGDVRVVTITEKIVLNDKVIEGIAKELNALLEDGRNRFIIDFHEIEFLSSLMLGKFMAFKRAVQARNGSLRLCGMNNEIFELFVLTNLVKFFDVRRSLEEAITSPF